MSDSTLTADAARPAPPGGSARLTPRGRSRTVLRLRRDRGAVIAASCLAVVIIAAVLAPLVATHDPYAQDLMNQLDGPSRRHWLGTDDLGRDIFSRLVHGGRVTLLAALQSVGVGVLLGVPPGLLAGYAAGRVSWATTVVADALLSFPPIILALAIVGIFGPGLTNAMLAVGLVLAPRFCKVAQAASFEVWRQTYMDAGRSIGCTPWRLATRHLLPNVSGPLLVQLSFAASVAIVAEASLSFLGLGVAPPTPTWGAMIKRASDQMWTSSWGLVPPSVMIAVTILALSTLGDSLRDALGRGRPE